MLTLTGCASVPPSLEQARIRERRPLLQRLYRVLTQSFRRLGRHSTTLGLSTLTLSLQRLAYTARRQYSTSQSTVTTQGSMFSRAPSLSQLVVRPPIHLVQSTLLTPRILTLNFAGAPLTRRRLRRRLPQRLALRRKGSNRGSGGQGRSDSHFSCVAIQLCTDFDRTMALPRPSQD